MKRSPGLRSSLTLLEEIGEPVFQITESLKADGEVAAHYAKHFSSIPAVGRSGDEEAVLYRNVPGGNMDVLLGLCGSRRRNELFVGGDASLKRLATLIDKPIRPEHVEKPACQEVVLDLPVNILRDLPVLKMTAEDAGHFITLGLAMAVDPETGQHLVSLHRMKVMSDDEMSIWISPMRTLSALHERSKALGRELPVSINIGVDPAIYLCSSFNGARLDKRCDKLELAGAMIGSAMEVAKCLSVDSQCVADAEVVIEGVLSNETVDEALQPGIDLSLPEFLGYPGKAGKSIQKFRATQITHRHQPIYQTLIGPGYEQSHMLGMPLEVMIFSKFRDSTPLTILDIYCGPAGGGLLLAIVKINKNQDSDDQQVKILGQQILQEFAVIKSVFIVDEPVNPRCAEDVLWAMTTRCQFERDLSIISGLTGLTLDPSQTAHYYGDVNGEPATSNIILDLTAPFALLSEFRRSFNVLVDTS